MRTLKTLLIAFTLFPFVLKGQTAQPRQHQHAAGTVLHHTDSLVRGVSFKAFSASVPGFSKSDSSLLAKKAWRLWKLEEWRRLYHLFKTDSLNGGWPPNSGALSLKIVTLDTSMLIDRFGGWYTADSVFHDKGTFVCKKGVPFPMRALQAASYKSPYRVYKVIKQIPGVKRGRIIPWFNEPGLGIQYQLPYSIDDLLQNGYIVHVNSKPLKWSPNIKHQGK